jgi:hypothetical protein
MGVNEILSDENAGHNIVLEGIKTRIKAVTLQGKPIIILLTSKNR